MATETSPSPAVAGTRIRPRRWVTAGRRVLLILGSLVVVLVTASALYLLTIPGVADAPLRARRIMASHHEPLTTMPVPGRLAAAVVSTEDEHFYDNIAVNILSGAGRAALATLQASRDPGGSTIQQQLAKELYGGQSGLSTVREIALGLKLALSYSKREILAMYLNISYYGQGSWGVTQAAEGYFHTPPSKLTWAQAAMLGGLLQAPSAYDPLTHYALARARQHQVLSQLVVNGYLGSAQATVAYRQPLAVR